MVTSSPSLGRTVVVEQGQIEGWESQALVLGVQRGPQFPHIQNERGGVSRC